MDTNSRAQPDAGDRSGGKFLRRRQKFTAKTPYDRPPPPQPAGETDSGSNWFRGLGLPGASRMIFSGATKLLPFMTDADNSSSSSSSDSEDDGSCDDIGDDNIPTDL